MAATDMITVDDLLDHLNRADAGTDAAEMAVHVSAASQTVEFFTGPVITREFVDHDLRGRCSLVLDRRPVVALVSVVDAVSGASHAISEFRVSPGAGVLHPAGGGRLPSGGPFTVTYTAGRAATVVDVPEALNLACRIVAAHLWETQRAPTMGPQLGGFSDDAATVSRAGFAVPWKARDLMAPYRTVAVA